MAITALTTLLLQLVPDLKRSYMGALDEGSIDTPLVPTLAELSGQEAYIPPEPPPSIVNVVFIGSDSREGAGNRGYGRFSGERSDTVLLAQVNPYTGTTTALSMPRDLWVRMPGCAGGSFNRFNAAFEIGGADCTVRLIKSITGVKVHHVIVMDFGAFKKVVGSLGGVEVCVNRKLTDQKSGLSLRAGTHRLNPEQALSFARSRYSTHDGSDLARIERQHYLISRLLTQVRAQVTNPAQAWQLVTELQPHLTVDHKFDPWDAAYLGLTATQGKLSLATIPYEFSSAAPFGTVVLDMDKAAKALEVLRNPQTKAPEAAPTPTPTPTPTGIPCTD